MSREPNPHIAIVLAAGGSSRLGRPKQLLTREGETLVHRAVRLASATQPQRVLLVCGAHAEAVADAVADLRVEIVFNGAWQEGLASSLRAAANALGANTASALILGCDQPALALVHLQRLLASGKASASGCAATLYNATRGIPAVASVALLEEGRTLKGDRGLRDGLQRIRAENIGLLKAPELEFDVDTAEDMKKAINDGLLDSLQATD